MPITWAQTSFWGGEWSETAQGRFEDPEYKIAMKVSLNGLPLEAAAWTRRPGTLEAGFTRLGAPARIFSYNFQENQPYLLEFTDNWLRFYQGTSLVYSNDATAISSISTDDPAVMTLGSAVTWQTGDTIIISGLGASCPTLHNRQLQLTQVSTTVFTLSDPITGATIDGSAIGTFAQGTANHVYELPTIYSGGSWANLRFIQGDGASIMLNAAYAPQVLSVLTPPSDSASATMSLAGVNFVDGPYIDPQTNDAQLVASGLSGIITLTISFPTWSATTAYAKGAYVVYSGDNNSYVSLTDQNLNQTPSGASTYWKLAIPATAINNGAGFTTNDIGRHIRLFSAPPAWILGHSYNAGDIVTYGTEAYWTCISGGTASATNAPGLGTNWGPNATAATWTWGKITNITTVVAPGTVTGTFGDGSNTSAAFDNSLSKSYSNSDTKSASFSNNGTETMYVGAHYSAGEVAESITLYPTSDKGLVQIPYYESYYANVNVSMTVSMYGSSTAPSNATNGTLLGQEVFDIGNQFCGAYGNFYTDSRGPFTIYSNQPSASFKYIWATISVTVTNVDSYKSRVVNFGINIGLAQLSISNPPNNDTGIQVELFGPNLLYHNPIDLWQLGLFTVASPYPTCGCYHEGRLWFSGVVPNRLDGSQPNQNWQTEINFGPSNLDVGNVTDSSAVSYTLNASTSNSILWMDSDQQGILIGTENNEWLMQATTQNAIITATNIQAHPVTRIGSALISSAEPVHCEHTIVFIQRFQRKLIEYFADVFSGKFAAPNLAKNAQHVTYDRLVQIAYQYSYTPVIWGVTATGGLVGCSYKRENLFSSQGPNFMGWHRHSLGSGRTVEYIATGPSPDGTSDTLALVTNDKVVAQVNGSKTMRHVEFLTPIFLEGDALQNAWFLDGGLVPTAYTNVVNGGLTYLQLYGLWPYVGLTVDVFAGGLDLGSWEVAVDGTLSIPYIPTIGGGLFTTAFVAGFSTLPVVVGFSYTSDGMTVSPQQPQDTGSRMGTGFGKIRRESWLFAKLVNSQGISFGTSFDKLHGAILKTYPTPYISYGRTVTLAANQLFTGTHRVVVSDDHSLEGPLGWRISRPFPCTVAAIGGSIAISDEV